MFSWMERYTSSLRLKEKSSLVSSETLDSVLHMVLRLKPKLSIVIVKSKYKTYEINNFDKPIPHL